VGSDRRWGVKTSNWYTLADRIYLPCGTVTNGLPLRLSNHHKICRCIHRVLGTSKKTIMTKFDGRQRNQRGLVYELLANPTGKLLTSLAAQTASPASASGNSARARLAADAPLVPVVSAAAVGFGPLAVVPR